MYNIVGLSRSDKSTYDCFLSIIPQKHIAQTLSPSLGVVARRQRKHKNIYGKPTNENNWPKLWASILKNIKKDFHFFRPAYFKSKIYQIQCYLPNLRTIWKDTHLSKYFSEMTAVPLNTIWILLTDLCSDYANI